MVTVVAAVSAALVAVPATAVGPKTVRRVEPVEIEVPAHGAAASVVSDSGVVAGVAYSEQGAITAFRWQGGEAELLPDAQGQSYAVDVTDDGTVLVQEYRTDWTSGALLWHPDGTTTELVPAPDGAEAWDVDDEGRVALDLVDEWGAETHAAVWHDGTLTRLDDRGGTSWVAHAGALDGRGGVVGTLMTDAGARAVVWRDGVPTELPLPDGAAESEATSVNAKGDVLGTVTEDGRSRAVVWERGAKPRHLLRDSTRQGFHDLNTHGVAVGQVGDASDGAHAARADRHGLSLLPTLGGSTGTAYAINDHDTVVGSSSTGSDVYGHAVAWVRGAAVPLGVDVGGERGVNSVALDVNERGQAVGYVQRLDDNGGLSFNSRALLWEVQSRS